MKEKDNKIKIFQWNRRSIMKNLLSFESYIEQNDFCILALQSLNVSYQKLPKLQNYFYPPICEYCRDKTDQKIYTAIYVRDDLEYSVINQVCTKTSAAIKFNKQTVLNAMSCLSATRSG